MSCQGDVSGEQGFYRTVVEWSPTAIVVLDMEGLIRFANEKAHVLLARDVVGSRFEALFTPPDRQRACGYVAGLAQSTTSTSMFFTADVAPVPGEAARFVHVHGSHARLPQQPSGLLVLTVIDSTEARQRENDLEHQALYDSLTGLPNRALLLERLRQVCTEDSPSGALMMVDMDGFKQVNDRLGHQIGDTLLFEVAQRLRQALPSSATIARLGGDEFAVLVPESAVDVATKLAAAVCQDISRPFLGVEYPVTASVGVTEVTDLEESLRQADLAMYAVKAAGGDGVVRYDLALERSLREDVHGAVSVSALRAERDRLHAEARTDPLTCLPNRRALDEFVASHAGKPASVLFVDVDRFSAYNHRHGDQRGDGALQQLAQTLTGNCRDSDRVFRKGGEEFVAVLPEADGIVARDAAERIRGAVEALALEHGGVPDVPIVTVTIGVAVQPNGDVNEAMRVAGERAYASKVAGRRNHVAAEAL
ncbi:sensor domain-containing diguanylate cyclase [Nocardioides mesophilus]|uniref:Diguanylate cyclase n=1 Tax=Nocardioides mesophilus TaxID=433659 RepID=A0A7G9RGB0_9ACTN|nr:diguanylate cyclase [Nocardioides mesophilus]QNN54635.1 diguanylate cyclase [Nocardioides mesophilus]